MKIEKLNSNESSKELLPQIIERIFLICKNDPNFKLKNELEIVENKTQSLNQKIARQDELLEQSNKVMSDLANRLNELMNENERKKMELIEALGDE